jgi:prepilin signal peptidase PulO-like enzyme (type II secretory pathway)
MIRALPLVADAALLAALAYLGTLLARLLTAGAQSFFDGPPPGRPAVRAIAAAAALAGACLGARGVSPPELALACLLAIALSGICYADVKYGLVPDMFTLVPLAALLAGDVLLHQWSAPVAVPLVATPFALAAAFSRGRGMGWGDVKLVALGAAVLGTQSALLACTAACFAAVAITTVRRRGSVPIAFAPYLVVAVAAAVVVRGTG